MYFNKRITFDLKLKSIMMTYINQNNFIFLFVIQNLSQNLSKIPHNFDYFLTKDTLYNLLSILLKKNSGINSELSNETSTNIEQATKAAS